MYISDPLGTEDCPVTRVLEGYDANVVWSTVPDTSSNVQKETNYTDEKPTHQRRSFSCFTCGKSYGRKKNLQRHVTYECGKEPQFQCPFCPQKCKRKSNQMRHIKRLHKDKVGLVTQRF